MCDRWDIGGLSTPRHPDTDAAQVFIYDAFPGGVGIAEKGSTSCPTCGAPPTTPSATVRARRLPELYPKPKMWE